MARIRGRSIKVTVDLPADLDAEDVANYVYEALEEKGASELDADDPLSNGMRVRTITYDKEVFEI